MEVSNGSIGQRQGAGGGGTLICIPSDTFPDDKRMLLLKKRSSRPLISESTGESHNNANRSASLSYKLSAPPSEKKMRGPRNPSISTTNSSSISSVASSGATESNSSSPLQTPWHFETVVSFSCDVGRLSSDVISAIDYDETGQLVATGGLARKVRICSYHELVSGTKWKAFQGGGGTSKLFTTICMPAKLSSLKWRPGSSEVIACGDYDGSVTEWDVAHGSTVSERYEHTGRTVWSIDYSCRDFPSELLASASSDSTVRFWSRNVERSVGAIKSAKGNSMCCVEFGRSCSSSSYVAVACADALVYLYDMRSLASPVTSFRGHERSVSYVRWLGDSNLVSSSPDGTIRLWNIENSYRAEQVLARRTFDSHSNSRNFVGLSVAASSGGLIASGSENNEVFVYSSSVEGPLLRHRFPCENKDHKAFVGSVCWTEQDDHWSLISANSEGVVQVIRATTSGARKHCCS